MKTLGIITGILVILAIISTPAFAITKSDLIAQYASNQRPVDNNQAPPYAEKPPRSSQTSLFPYDKPPFPNFITKPLPQAQIFTCPPDKPVGSLHRLLSYNRNPQTGEFIPLYGDDKMRLFIVKEGCQCPIV